MRKLLYLYCTCVTATWIKMQEHQLLQKAPSCPLRIIVILTNLKQLPLLCFLGHIFPGFEFHINGIISYILFHTEHLFYLAWCLWESSTSLCLSRGFILFTAIYYCINMPQCVFLLLMNFWCISSVWLLCVKLLQTLCLVDISPYLYWELCRSRNCWIIGICMVSCNRRYQTFSKMTGF